MINFIKVLKLLIIRNKITKMMNRLCKSLTLVDLDSATVFYDDRGLNYQILSNNTRSIIRIKSDGNTTTIDIEPIDMRSKHFEYKKFIYKDVFRDIEIHLKFLFRWASNQHYGLESKKVQ